MSLVLTDQAVFLLQHEQMHRKTTENHATAIGSHQSGQQTNEYRM